MLEKEIRKAFKPRDTNFRLFSADYSQIELRIMAHFSKEPTSLKLFQTMKMCMLELQL